MKRNNDYHYSGVSSFEDLKLEKSRLILKGRLLESRLKLDVLQIREFFSVTAIVASLARGSVLRKLYDLFGFLIHKTEK